MRVIWLAFSVLALAPSAMAQDEPALPARHSDAGDYGRLVGPAEAAPAQRMRDAGVYAGTELGRLIGRGTAAWYEHPGKTASGAIFDPNKLTAASPDLPLGSKVRVVNRKTQQSVDVEINDRMTTTKSIRRRFTIELSRAGAQAIGIEGVGPVAIFALDDAPPRETEARGPAPDQSEE